MSVFLEQALYGGGIVLVVVADYGIPVFVGRDASYTALYDFLLFEIQDHIGHLQVFAFETCRNSHDFVDLARRSGIIGQ